MMQEYFYDRFSAASAHNTYIDLTNYNKLIDFHFYTNQIFKILKYLDTNKSPGHDGITGTVLKKCSSLLFSILSGVNIY